MVKYNKKLYYDILKDIIEIFNLVQLMDSLVNANHAISIVGQWIYDSNYNKDLVINSESSDMICAPSVGEKKSC